MGQLCNEDVILALDDESDSDDYTVSNGTSAISSVNLTLQIIKSNSSKRDRYEFTVNKMSLTVEIMWYTVFLLMLIIAIGAHRRMRTVTNYFLVNLSVADVMLSVFNCVFNFIYMIHEDWNFGLTYCAINNHVGIVTVASSVFTLTGISIDRYLAIVRPLKPRMSKRWAQVIILLIWFTSFLLGGPYLLYSRIVVYRYSGKVQRSCIVIWPDGQATNSKVDHIYNLVLFFLTSIIPMIICYCFRYNLVLFTPLLRSAFLSYCAAKGRTPNRLNMGGAARRDFGVTLLQGWLSPFLSVLGSLQFPGR
uniref:Tachykinin-like peptides receptor 86C n=2 Tax=Cacopsylla melanoneura TaxID=428564 RepID=A0A8D8U4H2_9HEMI